MRDLDGALKRIAELERLEHGWLDGQGDKITISVIDAARQLLLALSRENIPIPYVFPREEGALNLEWDLPHCCGMEVIVHDDDEHAFTCYYFHAMPSHECDEFAFVNVDQVIAWLLHVHQPMES